MPLLTAALFIKTKRQKQPKCPSIYEKIKQNEYTMDKLIMEYYLAIKRNEVLIYVYATTWMNPENIMLNEVSHIHLYEIFRVGKFMKTESRLEITSSWEKGRMGSYCLIVAKFLFAVMKNFWKYSCNSCTIL